MASQPDKPPLPDGSLRQIFVARQPILDAEQNVFGFELLFRSGFVSAYDGIDGDHATRKVLADAYSQLGIFTLTGGKPAFVNFTQNLLLNEIPRAFPCASLYVEVLESVTPTPALIEACKRMKKAGYRIVLDDFVHREAQRALFDLAEIIKIDFRLTQGEEREKVVRLDPSKCFLAEKVETRAEFDEARRLGYELFQGHFFGEAVVVAGREIPGHKMVYLRLLREIQDPHMEFEKLEGIIGQDVSLSYKLLHFINTAAFGFSRIRSIKQALTLLGLDELRKWLSVVVLVILADEKPEILTINSLVRARFCELLALHSDCRKDAPELFLLGLFSLIDALLDKPMADLLKELPLSAEVKWALLGRENRFSIYLQAALLYENAQWDQYAKTAQAIGLSQEQVPALYFDTLAWANQAILGPAKA